MMRKFLAILVAMLLLIPAAGTAETDLSAMTDEELVQLRDAINVELAARTPTEGALATWELESCRIELTDIRVGTDDTLGSAIVLRFSFTNTGTEPAYFSYFANVCVYQDGVQCQSEYFENPNSYDAHTRVLPGGTFKDAICLAVANSDTPSITIEILGARYPYESAGMFTIALPEAEPIYSAD